MAVPDQVVIVGAQRCGSTSVAATLARHPQVAFATPLRPEPKFFLEPGTADRLPEYLGRFYPDADPRARVRCEKSTSYFESDQACKEIASAFPEARIVVVLRDPVDRARSHYDFSRRNGLEDLPLEQALDPAAEDRPWDTARVSVSPFRYLSRGRYVDDLHRWDAAFGPDAVHLVLLEELRAEPWRFEQLEADLGLDQSVSFEPDEAQNASADVSALDPDVRARLAAWFADANCDLATRLGRPLDRWTHV
jgi:Sulfotransferase domain